jgi:hypothetical protein
MSNRKEMPKQAFSGKLKKGEKISYQWDHLLVIKWTDIHVVFFLTTAYEVVLVDAPLSRGAHYTTKPAALLDYNKYKTGVDRSDQMLSHYLFERKTIKWWKELFLHLFDMVVVSAHILHNKTSKKEMLLEIFYKKVAEGLLASAGTEIQVQGQSSSPAGRLLGRDHSVYRIPEKQAKLERKSNCSCHMCGERGKCQTGKTVKKCTTMCCHKCNVGLYIGECYEVYHTKINCWE